MKISGLQKATVLDYPGEIACTIFYLPSKQRHYIITNRLTKTHPRDKIRPLKGSSFL